MLGSVEFGRNNRHPKDRIWYVELMLIHHEVPSARHSAYPDKSERAKVRKAMENMLQKAALKILAVVGRDKDHLPPITTTDANPFPYRIILNPRTDGWQNRFGLY